MRLDRFVRNLCKARVLHIVVGGEEVFIGLPDDLPEEYRKMRVHSHTGVWRGHQTVEAYKVVR